MCVCYTCTTDHCGFVCWHFQNGGNSKPFSTPLCRELIILLCYVSYSDYYYHIICNCVYIYIYMNDEW